MIQDQLCKPLPKLDIQPSWLRHNQTTGSKSHSFRHMRYLALPNSGWNSFKRNIVFNSKKKQLRAAGESLATKHSEEVSQMQKEVMEYKIRLHQAEAHASEIVRQAELELANRAKASQSHAENMTGELKPSQVRDGNCAPGTQDSK